MGLIRVWSRKKNGSRTLNQPKASRTTVGVGKERSWRNDLHVCGLYTPASVYRDFLYITFF